MDWARREYLSSGEVTIRRGRHLGRWEDRVIEYVSERGVRGNGLEWARRECMDREPPPPPPPPPLNSYLPSLFSIPPPFAHLFIFSPVPLNY